jgi:hypothetical protein
MSGAIWGQAGTLRVRREQPRSTARGKVMPLHVERRPAGPRQSPATRGLE